MERSAGNVESAVRSRYSKAAEAREVALCCPVEYNREYLKIIPQEVIDRDYGCGDPSAYVKAGETVLDLGSGGGKICFIASQVVGENGAVIGVDMNDEMLDLARTSAPKIAKTLGYDNVSFHKGKIQDLRLDRDRADRYLKESPITDETSLREFEGHVEDWRHNDPLVKDDSVDVVVSNCVLNLVATDEKNKMFEEIFRVLKRGGRAVISDIVADEHVPQEMQNDPVLWSGCISGSYEEKAFVQAFIDAGFYGAEVVKRDEKPWQTVDGIEFRSVTVIAYKGKEGECWDHNEAMIYKGPFKRVEDDDGHVFERGQRTAVCRKTFEIFSKAPYADYFYSVDPLEPVAEGAAKPFQCTGGTMERSARETKGQDYSETISCDPDSGCC